MSNEKKKKKIKIRMCPQCGGNELYYESGLITGYKYHCKNCDYIGALILEKEIDEEELANKKNKSH